MTEIAYGKETAEIRGAFEVLEERITSTLGPELGLPIEVVRGEPGDFIRIRGSERDLRLIRFALKRALFRT
jgi:hypothetical protein